MVVTAFRGGDREARDPMKCRTLLNRWEVASRNASPTP